MKKFRIHFTRIYEGIEYSDVGEFPGETEKAAKARLMKLIKQVNEVLPQVNISKIEAL